MKESVFPITGVAVPEVFTERRRPRPFRIIHMSVGAFVQRFILGEKGAPGAPPAVDRPVQTPAPSGEKTGPWKCGVAELDEQYDAMFKCIRQFHAALKSGAKPDVLEEKLASLESLVEGHLAMEEAYLELIGFPGVAEHRLGHKAFRHQIHAIHHRIVDGDAKARQELSQLLFAWMRLHVAKEDPVWSRFARAHRSH